MGQLRAFAKLITSLHGVDVDFAIVYIAEAHPTDGWMYPAVEQFAYRKQHTQLQDRLVAARALRTKLKDMELAAFSATAGGVPIFADAMNDAASLAFGALPERLAIVLDGQVRFIGGKGPEDYSMDHAAAALRALVTTL